MFARTKMVVLVSYLYAVEHNIETNVLDNGSENLLHKTMMLKYHEDFQFEIATRCVITWCGHIGFKVDDLLLCLAPNAQPNSPERETYANILGLSIYNAHTHTLYYFCADSYSYRITICKE